MPNRNKRGGKGFQHSPRERKKISFQRRYGMTPAEFRELKKNDPRKAHELKMKVQLK